MSTRTMAPPLATLDQVDPLLAQRGYAVVDVAQLAAMLGTLPGVPERAFAQWAGYWNRLPPDSYLRDGGRYRQRRHGSFVVEGNAITAVANRAHWQPQDYNALHGGIERWFQPLERAFLVEPLWQHLLLALVARADALRGPPSPQGPGTKSGKRPWYVEAHQFRIDTAGGIGRPTPEGAHRDGVDLVAVVLIARRGVKGGETRVFDADGPSGQRFTMEEPGTTLLLDDTRVIHETTPIQPVEPSRIGQRDTLVVTLRAGGFLAPA
jgi:hypothetical protein